MAAKNTQNSQVTMTTPPEATPLSSQELNAFMDGLAFCLSSDLPEQERLAKGLEITQAKLNETQQYSTVEEALLNEMGWGKQLDLESFKTDEFAENYCGWEIRLVIPNGGIIGVSIYETGKDYWWCVGTDDVFDYHNDKGIVSYAKRAIDKVNTHNQPLLDAIASTPYIDGVASNNFFKTN